MTLLEMNAAITRADKVVEYPEIPNDLLTTFAEILSISPAILSAAKEIEDSSVFYKMYPDIREVVGKTFASDVFYAYKVGYVYKGVPNKLCYILKLAKESEAGVDAPNFGLSKVSKLLKKYAGQKYVCNGAELTVKDIMDNIYGKSVRLLTDGTRKTMNGTFWEVYVPEVDRVLLLPDDIGKVLTFDDCCSLQWDPDVGVISNGKALRFFNNRVGITTDDFDLRESV